MLENGFSLNPFSHQSQFSIGLKQRTPAKPNWPDLDYGHEKRVLQTPTTITYHNRIS